MDKAQFSAKPPELTDQERAFVDLIVQILVEKIVKGGLEFDIVKDNSNKKATQFPV